MWARAVRGALQCVKFLKGRVTTARVGWTRFLLMLFLLLFAVLLIVEEHLLFLWDKVLMDWEDPVEYTHERFDPKSFPLSEEDQTHFVKEYRKAYQADPPRLLVANWLPFALSRNCPLHGDVYNKIRDDLRPFRHVLLRFGFSEGVRVLQSLVDRAVREADEHEGRLQVLEIRDGAVVRKVPSMPRLMQHVVSPLSQLLPDLRIPWNSNDEPKVVRGRSDEVEIFSQLEGEEAHRRDLGGTSHLLHPWGKDFLFLSEDNGARAFLQGRCSGDPLYERWKDLHGFFKWGSSPIFTDALLPVLSETKSRACGFADLTVPANFYVMPGIRVSLGRLTKGIAPWEKKKDKIFWRGSSTGCLHTLAAFFGGKEGPGNFSCHRLRFVRFANHPTRNALADKTDVALNGPNQCLPNKGGAGIDMCKFLVGTHRVGGSVSWQQFVNHKVIVDIEGNSFSERFFRFAVESGSVIVRIEKVFNDWWDGLFLPWVHFVPVKLDFSDWNENLSWVFQNPKEAKAMAERMQTDARRFLRIECQQCFVSRLLIEYASLISGEEREDETLRTSINGSDAALPE